MSGKVYVEQTAPQQLWNKGFALLNVLPMLKEARRLVRARLRVCVRMICGLRIDLCSDRSHGIPLLYFGPSLSCARHVSAVRRRG